MFADFIAQKTPFSRKFVPGISNFVQKSITILATFSKNSGSVNVKVIQEINQ